MERKKYRLVCNRIVEYMLQASSCGSNGLTMLTFLEKRPKKLKNILKDEREKIMSWECPECAFLNNASASKCICGYEPNTTVTAASLPTESLQTNSSIDSEKAQSSEISQVQPWLRFGARVIDYNLNALNLFFIIGFFIGFAAPHSIESFNLMLGNFFYSILFGMAFMFIWVYIEAQLLCSWGTTPGRWVLGIVLRDLNGQKLSFSDALKRSFSV